MNTATGAQFFQLAVLDRIDDASVRIGARASRRQDLTSEKMDAEFKKYMARLRAQAIIEWKNEDLKKAWEIGIAAEPTF